MNKRTNQWLAAVVVLQVLVLLGQWAGPAWQGTPAQAQVVDPGAQRVQMIEEQKATNAKLEKLIGILESGNLQVKVATPDESKKAPAK